MPRWGTCTSKIFRWSSPVAQGLILCVLTFGVILPICCHHVLYSHYFLKNVYLDSLSDASLQESYNRGQEALHFWENAASTKSLKDPLETDATKPDLLVTIVTARRTEGRDYHYLLQVVQQLKLLLKACGDKPCAEVMLCDVESGPALNEDALLLEKQFLVVRRSPDEKWHNKDVTNIFEKEKRDYVYCLRKGWDLMRPKNTVVLEDDALPMTDFFPLIKNLLSRRFARNTLYIKLYHPERLQGYWNPEPYRILEWLGLGLFGATILLLFFSHCTPLSFTFSPLHLLFLTLYIMAVAELAGRHYLLEIRRLSPQLYAVSPATECCTPAMLYPGNASIRVAEYLDHAVCAQGNAKDMVLYKKARSMPGEKAHSVEPNIIKHIGAFSSIRMNPVLPKLI
ncbi:transmembrane protein 246 [Ctenopharyngodon idella]|uniref:transmembrane protein 246 n=1 Tax=Ctenopharyngodon idella TaxID=7959 RepID=UPI0022312F52|nr:transmembrane protein 246 [Ctenopharyngodon idella]XP_051768987.1 transmembrane protein 246 [Ctenopharyngodon idella]